MGRVVAAKRFKRYLWVAGAGVGILLLALLTVLANAVTLVITLVILAGVIFALSKLVVTGAQEGRRHG
jgi:hypothetical protein